MHGNPDVSRFVVRVDSFGPDGEPGVAPNSDQIETSLAAVLNAAGVNAANGQNITYNVEVEEVLN